MSMGRVSSNGVKERIGQLCSEFKLPTVGAEAGPRFTAAGHTDALHTLVEVLEQEAEDRRQRRIIRIRRAARLPVGKTWDTFEHDRVPVALRQQLGELGRWDLRRERCQCPGLRTARHRQVPRHVCHRPPAG